MKLDLTVRYARAMLGHRSGRLLARATPSLILGLLLLVASGCALGTRMPAPAPEVVVGGDTGGPTTAPKFIGTRFTNQAGFRLAAAHEQPFREEKVILDGRLAEAEEGSHYLVVGITVHNRSRLEEAPYLVGDPEQVPRVWLGVPREQARDLRATCPDVPGLERVLPRSSWCAVPLRLKCVPVGSTALALPALPPESVVTDYLYSMTPLPDRALTDQKMATWRFALQSGANSYVALRSSS